MIQESRRLIAQSLINYTKLPTTKQAVFEEKTGEYMFRRVRRPGCPLSEYDLRDQLIDCTSAILKGVASENGKNRTLSRSSALTHSVEHVPVP